MATEFAAPLLRDLVAAYETCDWDAATLKTVMDELGGAYDVKRKAQAPARVAVTGRSGGPPLFEMLEVLGRDETLRRLRGRLSPAAMTDEAVEAEAGVSDPGPEAPDRSTQVVVEEVGAGRAGAGVLGGRASCTTR